MSRCWECEDGEKRFRDPVTGLWCHPIRSGYDPHPSPTVCGRQDPPKGAIAVPAVALRDARVVGVICPYCRAEGPPADLAWLDGHGRGKCDVKG